MNVFPKNKEWKKANVVPVHKKGNKQLIHKYRPLSFLLISAKLFEKFIFDCISGNVCYLAHFFIGSKEIQKNLY